MRVLLLSVDVKPGKAAYPQVDEFVKRISRFAEPQQVTVKTEAEFMARLEKERAAGSVLAVLLDSRGKLYTSEEFADEIRRARDGGKRTIVFAVGPPDGWSEAALKLADAMLSLGKMTLPHQLAYLVMTEQVYRGFTILAGHPYHSGH